MKHEVIKYGKKFGETIKIFREHIPNEVGELATEFARHFGIVAAKIEGEDKAGRAKLELQTVEEVVQRSCDLAEKLWAEMNKRGWILDLPIPKAPQISDEDIDAARVAPAD